ncbi:deoxycytidylate deaminase [Desulfitobacterium dichloroeliminans LMG P-21439]|uniref:Deoxycytidylate deaminase n=1 Tax=Desulfitobacterium dichloroeliminans (strain LMG P-21439 / DCA1) TaxID=871963 RepID=L0FAI8_DESDL|nr:dCMP deaminase family protein [Desulfitobacterium dichloroeliminans]AGA70834.1 deoxycytidylate deaminase [Desulfitobacterium dichloroeliminans LMG P-21439]
MKRLERPGWDEYFMQMAQVVAGRSTCLRRQVGAVIVKDKQILSTGYNGSPSGLSHCAEKGCLRQQLGIPSGERAEICRAVHAEQNALVQAAKHGVVINGADIYTTVQPCVLCTKLLINAGIKRVFYLYPYPDSLALELATEADLELVQLNLQEAEG